MGQRGNKRLDPAYLQGGYFNADRRLRREVIVDWPQQMAEDLADAGMTHSALRRFFGRLRAIEQRLRTGEAFADIVPALHKFKPLVAYAANRDRGVPEEFRKFLDQNVDLAVLNEEHFRAFVEHFQSVVAFFREKKDRRRG